jgi:hypothetical protein
MPDDSFTLSWPEVLKYAWKSIRASWTTLLTGTVTITVLSIVLPWGGAYHFSESGWDRVAGGSATWSLLAIPVWLVGAATWHLVRAPVGRARDVLAEQEHQRDAVEQELATTRYELARERAAAQVFGEAPVPQRIEGRLIRLADLPPGLWLYGNSIENCELTGPAKVLISDGDFARNHFFGYNDGTFVVVDDLEAHFGDAIIFLRCHVYDCKFHNITVLGSKETIASLRGTTKEMKAK